MNKMNVGIKKRGDFAYWFGLFLWETQEIIYQKKKRKFSPAIAEEVHKRWDNDPIKRIYVYKHTFYIVFWNDATSLKMVVPSLLVPSFLQYSLFEQRQHNVHLCFQRILHLFPACSWVPISGT